MQFPCTRFLLLLLFVSSEIFFFVFFFPFLPSPMVAMWCAWRTTHLHSLYLGCISFLFSVNFLPYGYLLLPPESITRISLFNRDFVARRFFVFSVHFFYFCISYIPTFILSGSLYAVQVSILSVVYISLSLSIPLSVCCASTAALRFVQTVIINLVANWKILRVFCVSV